MLHTTNCDPKSLLLATKRGNPINNQQFIEVNQLDYNGYIEHQKNYGIGIVMRLKVSPLYNCHGLTFASRRTGLYDNDVLLQILEEDSYAEIQREQVLPGDVILYYGLDGDIEHSGIVVEAPTEANLYIPRIFSKWGRCMEAVHLANQCPYNFNNHKYFRIEEDEVTNSKLRSTEKNIYGG